MCISLLDHILHGYIYDSIIVGFLAVLGINHNGGYHDPIAYTSHLSAFIKMAQLLVIKRAQLAVEKGEVACPADMLDVLQEWFMAFGSWSPVDWVHKLRAYGKKVCDSTTAIGFITWSDDGQEISYKDFKMNMPAFKHFVSHEIEAAQAQLSELLLVDSHDHPEIGLQGLKDDATIKTPG